MVEDVLTQTLALIAALVVVGLAPLMKPLLGHLRLWLMRKSSICKLMFMSFMIDDLHKISRVWPDHNAVCVHLGRPLGDVFLVAKSSRTLVALQQLLQEKEFVLDGYYARWKPESPEEEEARVNQQDRF